jgi:hypothetical protein
MCDNAVKIEKAEKIKAIDSNSIVYQLWKLIKP